MSDAPSPSSTLSRPSSSGSDAEAGAGPIPGPIPAIVAKVFIHLDGQPLSLFELTQEQWEWFMPVPRKLLLYAAGSFMGAEGVLYDDVECTMKSIMHGEEGKTPRDHYFRSPDTGAFLFARVCDGDKILNVPRQTSHTA